MATLTACRIVRFPNISSFGLRVLEDGRPYVEERLWSCLPAGNASYIPTPAREIVWVMLGELSVIVIVPFLGPV
jgi:hypothetical protein